MYYNEYDEIPYEPSLADEILEEASTRLICAIKQSVANHIEEIKQKNVRLEAENKSLKEKVLAVNQVKINLQAEREELKRKASRMPVGEFLGQRGVIMYRADYSWDRGPKCNKCDDNRNRPYITPLGNNAKEVCTCFVNHKVYSPHEYRMSSMKRHERQQEIFVWFKRYKPDSDTYESSKFVKEENVYNGGDFSDIDNRETYFFNEDECQLYCDWLNEQKS